MKESENNLSVFKTPEENLAYALIEDAKESIISKTDFKISETEKVPWEDELRWLMSTEEEIPESLSFVDCCTILKWDCTKTRKYYLEQIGETGD